MDNYRFQKNLSDLYLALQDDLSKKVFWAQIKYDTEGSWANLLDLAELMET